MLLDARDSVQHQVPLAKINSLWANSVHLWFEHFQ